MEISRETQSKIADITKEILEYVEARAKEIDVDVPIDAKVPILATSLWLTMYCATKIADKDKLKKHLFGAINDLDKSMDMLKSDSVH